jgi:hypothetical protein
MLHRQVVDHLKKRCLAAGACSAVGWLGLACLLFIAGPASAQPSEADRATARALAGEGYRALKADDYQTAEDRFRRADALVHAPTLVVDHARALVGLGRLVEAHERYELVLREGVPARALPAWKKALKEATKELEVLKPRLAWLTITVKGPSEFSVTVNDKPVPAAALGVRRATDPGSVRVGATAEDYFADEKALTLGEGEEQSVELELQPRPKPPPPRPPVVPSGPPTPPVEQPQPAANRTLAYVAFGTGGVGLVVGAVFGVMYFNKYADLEPYAVDGNLDPKYEPDRNALRTRGWISGAGWVVGVAGVAVGTTLWMNGKKRESVTGPSRAHIGPWLGPTSVGLEGKF